MTFSAYHYKHNCNFLLLLNIYGDHFIFILFKKNYQVPSVQLDAFVSVDVLSGNLFDCGQTYPASDPSTDIYNCGSQNLDVSLVLWFVCTGIVILIILRVAFFKMHNVRTIERREYEETMSSLSWLAVWRGIATDERAQNYFPEVTRLLLLLSQLKSIALLLGCIIVFGTVILYSNLKLGKASSQFKTHSVQYTFLIS